MFLSALLMLPVLSPAPFLRTPTIHGDQVAFASEGDIWVGDIKSGEAHRLTSDPGVESKPIFSPDGSSLCFLGEYDGDRQLYTIPTGGGIPKRITNLSNMRAATCWTPDGQSVAFRRVGSPTPYQYYTVSATGGTASKLPLEFAAYLSMAPNGQDFAFTRFNHTTAAWFKYIGGLQNQIWVSEGGKFRSITNLAGTNEFPVWAGNRIYFSHEEKGKFSLMSVEATGREVRTEVAADDFEIRELSTDGSRIIFEHGQEVQVFDPATKSSQMLNLHLNSDLIHMRKFREPADRHLFGLSPTGTGKRVFAESRGQIVTLPIEDGEARIWKAKAGVRYREPAMSPDAKSVAYFCDEGGQQHLFVANADGSGERQLTRDIKGQLVQLTWSPDSKSILVFDSHMRMRLVNVEKATEQLVVKTNFTWTQPPTAFSPDSKWIVTIDPKPVTTYGQIKLFEIATGKTTTIDDPMGDNQAARFSQDGQFLVVVTRRNFSVSDDGYLNQLNTKDMMVPMLLPLRADVADPLALKDPNEEVKKEEPKKADSPASTTIDFAGMMDRRLELPCQAGTYTDAWMVGTKVYLQTLGALKVFDIPTKSLSDFAPGAGFTLTPDGKLFFANAGAQSYTADIASGARKRMILGGLTVEVDPAQEWRQIFWEAWRYLRDYFYVENMHGLDWAAEGEKFAKYLPNVRSRNELDELIRWMQSDLGSSHEYLTPGDTQDNKKRIATPSLGIDIAADRSGFYKITHIVKGDGFLASERSPLIGLGMDVHEGMYLIEVAGVPVSTDTDAFAALAGRAGQTISIKVNTKPSAEGAKTILVKPVADDSKMRYREWVQANRDYVTKASGGKLGYVHMSAMEPSDFQDFVRQYMAQRDKEGFVIDDRYNNGGYVQEMVNRILATRISGFFNQRDSDHSWTRQTDYFNGPMVCLINEFDISCGEEFPYRFKQLNLGPLIGRRTMGGEVGSDPGWKFADGGSVSVPNYGFWTPEKGWQIEGRGVEPDIDVPSDPNLFVQGKDPQLDKAVEYLMAHVPKSQPWKAPLPKSKDRVKDGGR